MCAYIPFSFIAFTAATHAWISAVLFVGLPTTGSDIFLKLKKETSYLLGIFYGFSFCNLQRMVVSKPGSNTSSGSLSSIILTSPINVNNNITLFYLKVLFSLFAWRVSVGRRSWPLQAWSGSHSSAMYKAKSNKLRWKNMFYSTTDDVVPFKCFASVNFVLISLISLNKSWILLSASVNLFSKTVTSKLFL